MNREFTRRSMALAAWRVKRCPPRDKAANREKAMAAIKQFLEGALRDRVDSRERTG